MLRESREKFLSSLASEFKDNPKRYWSVLKQTSKSKSVPDLISTATSEASDSVTSPLSRRVSADNPKGIANLFNKYFATVFTSSDVKDQTSEPDEPVITELVLCGPLKSLETTKATGPDIIPARLLRQTADVIAPSLCKLFNNHLIQGHLEAGKRSTCVKKGDKEHTANYRPISLLSITSKVLECCVLNNIKDHLLETINTAS